MSEDQPRHLNLQRFLGELCNEFGVTKEEFEDVREALEQLAESLNRDAGLHPSGLLRVKSMLRNTLKQRLDIKAAFARQPGSLRRSIKRPLIIVGLPRSGTSLLHHLMNQDAENRTPRLWELSYPVPAPEPASYTSDPRIAQTEHDLRRLYAAQPALREARLLASQEPDECELIFNRCLMNVRLAMQFSIPGYTQWLWRQPLADLYSWYRNELLLLQTNVLGDWVLKSPFHMWGVEELRKQFPDALLVQVHRDPFEVIASGSAYCELLRQGFSDRVDPRVCGREWSELVTRYIGHFDQWRDQDAAGAAESVMDISYRKLTADPLGTVTSIYRRWGKKLGLDARMKIQAWLKAHSRASGMQNTGDPPRFGLERGTLSPDIAAYSARHHAFL